MKCPPDVTCGGPREVKLASAFKSS